MEKQEWSADTGQTYQIVTRDCYVRLLLTQNYAENVDQSYTLFNKIFCKIKQKISNILLLMYSAHFMKLKRLAISVKKCNFKKASLPMFYKTRRPRINVMSSFSLRYFPAIPSQNIHQYNSRNFQLELFDPTSPTKEGQTTQQTFVLMKTS